MASIVVTCFLSVWPYLKHGVLTTAHLCLTWLGVSLWLTALGDSGGVLPEVTHRVMYFMKPKMHRCWCLCWSSRRSHWLFFMVRSQDCHLAAGSCEMPLISETLNCGRMGMCLKMSCRWPRDCHSLRWVLGDSLTHENRGGSLCWLPFQNFTTLLNDIPLLWPCDINWGTFSLL